MFQSARLSAPLSATDFDRLEPAVRTALLSAQRRVIQTGAMSVVVVVAGVDGAGKNDAIARLHEWMDVRYLACNAYEEETDVERARPAMWRYWRDLPARGETSVVVGSWYNEPLRRFVLGDLDEAGFERALARINRFEEMLARENVLLLKVWFSLRPKEQKARLKALKKKARARRILAEWTISTTPAMRRRRSSVPRLPPPPRPRPGSSFPPRMPAPGTLPSGVVWKWPSAAALRCCCRPIRRRQAFQACRRAHPPCPARSRRRSPRRPRRLPPFPRPALMSPLRLFHRSRM